MKVIWGLINPDMFVPVADSIEDIMQQSLPKFIDAIRISDIGQGTNPFRIISMRALPDQPGDKEYPRDEWIADGKAPGTSPAGASKEDKALEKRELLGDGGKDLDQSGDYVVRITPWGP